MAFVVATATGLIAPALNPPVALAQGAPAPQSAQVAVHSCPLNVPPGAVRCHSLVLRPATGDTTE